MIKTANLNLTNALTEGYDAAVDRRNALAQQERANKLADLQMQEYERARAEKEGVRNYLSGADLADPTVRAGLARFGETGMAYNAALSAQEKAALEKQKTQLEIDAKKFENKNKQLDYVWSGIGASATPQNAIDYITQGVKDGNLSMVQGSAEIQRLQNISQDDFRKYKIENVLKVLDAKEKLAQFTQKTRDTDLGGYIERRIEDAQGNVIGAPQQLRKTPTISDVTAQGNLALAQKRLEFEQANPNITVQQLENGDLVGVNSRTGQAMPITMGGGAPAAQTGNLGMPAAPAVGTLLRGKSTALTESQSNAVAFGMRMKEANAILQDLAGKGTLKGANIEATPFVGESLGKVLPSFLGGTNAQQQQVNQAKSNFITAVLRKESGAAIGKNEFDTEDKKYFPQFGDSAAVIKQKENARNLAIQSMGIQAGPGAKNIDEYQPSVGSTNTVTDPTGMVHTFPTAEAAAAFKKAAKIK
jgi:hypothetical protein